MNKILTLIVVLFVGLNIYGQPCHGFHKNKICRINKEGFKPFGQSRSTTMEMDSTSKHPVIFYGRMHYVVTVCSEKGYYPIHFKIIDAQSKSVIYDNMNDDYYESIGFTIDVTQKVYIEVTLLAEGLKPKDFDDTQACIGLNIHWKKAPRIGFRNE